MPANSNDYDRRYRSLRKESVKTILIMVLNIKEDLENLRKEVANLRKEFGSLNGSPRKGSPKPPPKESPSLILPGIPPVRLASDIPQHGGTTEAKLNGGLNGQRRGTRLSPDWELSEQDREFAVEHRIDPDATFAHFRDYWFAKSGADATKLDWSATWRNWCRRAQSDKGKGASTFLAKQQHRERVRAAMVRYALERDGS